MMRIFPILIMIVGFGGCGSPGQQIYEVKHVNYTVQVAPMRSADGSGNDLRRYQVRIFPGQRFSGLADPAMRESLWYRADSSFYLQHADGGQYPVLVQPVANGQRNSFEFMVVFEDWGADKGAKFVFDDRHVTKEEYLVNLF